MSKQVYETDETLTVNIFDYYAINNGYIWRLFSSYKLSYNNTLKFSL